MAGGLAMERAEQYQGKLTSYVVIASIIASLGGFIFGYVGIFGQVTVQDIFYDLFLVDVYKKNPRDYDYCKYSRLDFPLYVGPLYLAGSLAALLAYPFARRYGRRRSIILAGVCLFIGGGVGVYPSHLAIVLTSQIILGIGIGFGIQVILLYLSEIAPARFRGGLNMMFHLGTTLGLLAGNMIKNKLREEYFEAWLFYFSMGLPALPALFMIVGGIKFLPESPNSLVERGLGEKGREVLEKIRGTENVDDEFQDIVEASEFVNNGTRPHFHAIRNILERRNRPQLVMAILMPMFQNLTGIVFVFVYAPLLFRSMGFSDDKASLYSTAINGTILVTSTLVSMVTVDKYGRRSLLVNGGIVMFTCQVIIALRLRFKFFGDQLTTEGLSIMVTILIAIFVLHYGCSWGPLGLTIPSEIFTLETRSVGQSIAVSINLLFTYIVLQFFIPLLCAFKFGLFLFFAGWIVVMTIFVYFFLPETKGVPIEEMAFLWSKHWFWKRFVTADSEGLHVVQKSPTPNQV